MKLEQIDTSTDEGKLEVMRKAILDGRRVVSFAAGVWLEEQRPVWNWPAYNYAIIAEPVGPDDLWALLDPRGHVIDVTAVKERFSHSSNTGVVRYRRVEE